MRLIDADDIPYTMLYKENWMKGSGEEAQGAWKRDIDKMPTIDAAPVKHGEWIDPAAEDCYRCSVCEEYTHMEMPRLLYHYCPNCGARMKEEG